MYCIDLADSYAASVVFWAIKKCGGEMRDGITWSFLSKSKPAAGPEY